MQMVLIFFVGNKKFVRKYCTEFQNLILKRFTLTIKLFSCCTITKNAHINILISKYKIFQHSSTVLKEMLLKLELLRTLKEALLYYIFYCFKIL